MHVVIVCQLRTRGGPADAIRPDGPSVAGYPPNESFETPLAVPALALNPDADTPRVLKIADGVSLVTWFAVLYCGRMLPCLATGN